MSRSDRLERVTVLLVAAHTVGIGAMLAVFPAFAVRFAGWGRAEPLFFVRQAGIFHFVLAFGYLTEHFRYRGVRLLLAAKGLAALFLLSASAFDAVPWAVPFSGAADGLMGAAVWRLHRKAEQARRNPLPAVNPDT